ncbi:peroxidase family protein [Catellatospora coxensis]
MALLRAHNRIVDLLREAGTAEVDVFDKARITLTWHYQWIVVHDFLPRLVGTELVEQVLAEGGRWFAPPVGQAYIPLEFADAAFRYGHGQIRHTYRLVDGGPAVPLFPDLVGFGPVPADQTRPRPGLRPARPPARAAPNASTGGSPPASSACPSRSPGRSTRRRTARWPSGTCCAATRPRCPAAKPSPGCSGWTR